MPTQGKAGAEVLDAGDEVKMKNPLYSEDDYEDTPFEHDDSENISKKSSGPRPSSAPAKWDDSKAESAGFEQNVKLIAGVAAGVGCLMITFLFFVAAAGSSGATCGHLLLRAHPCSRN